MKRTKLKVEIEFISTEMSVQKINDIVDQIQAKIIELLKDTKWKLKTSKWSL